MSYFNNYDLKRLELYSRNMADYHLVTDLIPKCTTMFYYNNLIYLFLVSLLYFTNKVSFSLSLIQKVFDLLIIFKLYLYFLVYSH